MLKQFISIVISAVLLLGICGCSNDGQYPAKEDMKAESTIISFLNWISAEEVSVKSIMQIEDLYKQKNPGIEIKNIPITWDSARQQIFTLLASNNAPEMAQIAGPWFGQLAATGELEPLDDYIDNSVFNMYDRKILQQYTINGKIHALPWTDVSLAVFWNVKLLKRAGLDPANVPKTFEEFDYAVQRMSALGIDSNGEKIYGFGLPNNADELSVNVFNCFLKSRGSDFLDDTGKVSVKEDEILKLLKWYRYLADKGAVPKGFAFKDQYTLFMNNRIGGFIDGTYGRENLILMSGKGSEYKDNIVLGPMPAVNGNAGVGNNDHVLVMFKQTENKKETGKFISFLGTDKKAAEDYFHATGYIPASANLLHDQLYSSDPDIKVFLGQLQYKFNYAIGKTQHYSDAAEYIGTGLNMVTMGRMIPKEGAKYIIDNLNNLYGQ